MTTTILAARQTPGRARADWAAVSCALLIVFCGCGRPSPAGKGTPNLINDLNATAAETRLAAAAKLGESRDAAAVRPLCAALRDIRADVRREAIIALGKIGDRAAVGPLGDATCRGPAGNEESRLAAEALGRIGDASAVPILDTALHSSDSGLAYAAAQALGRIGGDAALKALIAALADAQPHTRRAAAASLGAIATNLSRETLRSLLADRDPDIRLSAAENLAALRDTNAVPAIVALLLDPSETVRRGLPRVVAELGNLAVTPLTDILTIRTRTVSRTDAAGAAVEVPVGPAQDTALDLLLRLNGVPVIRPLMLAMVLRNNSEAAERLKRQLGDPDCRAELLRAMAESPEMQSVGLRSLTAFCGDAIADRDAARDRRTLLAEMGLSDAGAIAKAAAGAIAGPDPETRFTAARLLGLLADARGRKVLLDEFWRQMEVVKKAWAKYQAAVADAEKTAAETGKDPRKQVVKQGNKDVSQHEVDERARRDVFSREADGAAARAQVCLSALLALADKPLAAELLPVLGIADAHVCRNWSGVIAAVIAILERAPDPSFADHLLPLMQGESYGLKPRVAHALGVLKDPRGFDPIAAYLFPAGRGMPNDQYFLDIRRQCYQGLFGCDRARAVELVGKILVDISPHQAAALMSTAELYGQFPDARSVAPLTHWVDHDVKEVQDAIHKALISVGRENVQWLVEGLNVESSSKRSALAGVIADGFGQQATPLLLAAARDSRPRLRQGAIWALASIGGTEARAAVGAALKDDHAAVRTAAAWGVGRLRDASLGEPVLALLADADATVRAMAGRQLGGIGGAAAVQPLIGALRDADAPVRASAAYSLARLKAGEAIDALRPLLEDENPDVQTAAKLALKALSPVGAPPAP